MKYVLDSMQVRELAQRLETWLSSGPGESERFDLDTTLQGMLAPLPTIGPDDWVFSPARAARYVQTYEQRLDSNRKPKDSPHHVRCQFVNGAGVRCRKGEGHENMPSQGAHEAPT